MLELLVSLGLGSILLSVGVASFSTLTESYTLSSAISQLQSDVLYVRSQAVASGCGHTFSVDPGGSSYKALANSECFYGSFREADRLVLSRKLSLNTSVSIQPNISINAQGFLIDESGQPLAVQMTLCSRSSCRQKTFANGGAFYE